MGGSDRHLHDIGRTLEINPDGVDQPVLDQWITQFGVAELGSRAQALVGRT